MNYYKRHIGDYLRDAAHLSLLKHGIYARLLDVYYAREEPIPQARAAHLIAARSKAERTALIEVLQEFFVLTDGCWYQSRCEEEIAATRGAQQSGVEEGLPATNASRRQRRWRERRAAMFDELCSLGIVLPVETSTQQLVDALERARVGARQDSKGGTVRSDVSRNVSGDVTRDVCADVTRDVGHVSRDATGDVTRDGKPLATNHHPNTSGSNNDGVSCGASACGVVGVTEDVTRESLRDVCPDSVSRDVSPEDRVEDDPAMDPASRMADSGGEPELRQAPGAQCRGAVNGGRRLPNGVADVPASSVPVDLQVMEDSGAAPDALKAPLASGDVAVALIGWERERNKVARMFASQRQVIDLAGLNVTHDELRRAYDAAVAERVASHDPMPVNAGFVRTFIEKGRRAPPLPRASSGWSGEGKFDPVAYLSRRSASAASVVDVKNHVVGR